MQAVARDAGRIQRQKLFHPVGDRCGCAWRGQILGRFGVNRHACDAVLPEARYLTEVNIVEMTATDGIPGK